MLIIKRISKIVFIITLFFLFTPIIKDINYKERIDNALNIKKGKNIYEGYLYIPRFNYKNLIKIGDNVLDENLIEMLSFSDKIGESNIILAGHNNNYVFGNLYDLDIGNEIILSDFNLDYRYIVKELKYVKVNDYSIFENKDSITLITCTNNNQKRYVVIAKRE